MTDHIAVPIKCLDSRQQFFVVSEGYEDLRVVSDGLLQHRKRPLADFMFFQCPQLRLVKLGLWDMDVLTAMS